MKEKKERERKMDSSLRWNDKKEAGMTRKIETKTTNVIARNPEAITAILTNSRRKIMTHKITKTLRSGCLIIAFSLLFTLNASAQNCSTPPTCEALGYTLTENDCRDAFSLKCPFNTTKVYCSVKCRVGYYAYSDGSCYQVKNPNKTFRGIIINATERTVWALNSALTGIMGVKAATWQGAPALCEGMNSRTRLGSKEELEIWASYFPESKPPVAPAIRQTVWTVSENDASTAWAYTVDIGTGIVNKEPKSKDTKLGLFCVEDL